MKQAKLRWVALCVALVFLIGTVIFGAAASRTPVASAQAATGTARPGIITVVTAEPGAISTAPVATARAGVGTPATGAAGATPAPTSSLAIPMLGSAPITSTATISGTGYTGTSIPGTITVVGEGTVKLKPDIARAQIGVDAVSPTVRTATDEARTTMTAVLKALADQGVADNDIQTANFNIYVERNTPPPSPNATGTVTEVVRYHVTNSVNVTIRDISKVGSVLDAAIQAGANNIFGVNFAVDDPTSVESQARQAAVADAQRRAADLARLNGVHVGPVLGISEVIGNQPGVISNNFRQSTAVGLGGGGGPVNPGELELTMQLQITYGLQ